MPTEADFLRAIIADPDADGPRLVYADWREDCGDTARAEFVRVQCALAAMPEEERQLHPLVERERELELALRDEWLFPLRTLLDGGRHGWWNPRRWMFQRPADGPAAAKFGRGFVEYLQLETTAFVRAARALTQTTPLRGLTLVPAKGINSPAAWQRLVDCVELRDLITFHVITHRLNPAEMRRFGERRDLTRLRGFGLVNPGFDTEALEALVRSPLLRQLRGLHVVSAGTAMSHTAGLLFGPECRHLRTLYLGGFSEVDSRFLERLAASPGFEGLTFLAVTGSPVGNVELDEFLGWLPLSLTHLDLSRVGLGDRSVASLANALRLRQLRTLDLANNHITAVGALILADSPNLLASTKLDLRGNPISRRVREALRIRCGHHVLV
jgi:uncharacterized protein (TIGR02996 family)